MDNIDQFNLIVATVFKELYSSFPRPVDLRVADIREAAQLPDAAWWENRGGMNPVGCAIEWLREEGFIRYTGSSAHAVYAGVVLTSKGFAALNKPPESLSTKQTIGARLKELSVSATNQTVAAIVRIALNQASNIGA